MSRRVTLHLELDSTEATMLRDAARRARLRPSQYAHDRLFRVAEYEIKAQMEAETAQAPSDIDADAEADALLMLQGSGERLQRWRSGKPRRPKAYDISR